MSEKERQFLMDEGTFNQFVLKEEYEKIQKERDRYRKALEKGIKRLKTFKTDESDVWMEMEEALKEPQEEGKK